MDASRLSARSVWCRVGVCVVTLLALDQAVRPVLDWSERRRYESGVSVRFGSSDLFLIGPLTEYLREHPVSRRPRVVFFGNSTVWGYSLGDADTISAMYQRLAPQTQVLNLGMNGFQSGGAYLITKDIVDSVDVVYVFDQGSEAHPMLAKLIPVSPEDIARYQLNPPPVTGFVDRAAKAWNLARYSYRLQGAWFGMSARDYLYINKTEWIKSLFGRAVSAHARADWPEAPAEAGIWNAPVAWWRPSANQSRRLAQRYPLVWDFAQLVADHGKHGVIVEYVFEGGARPMSWWDRALLNARFRPHVIVAHLRIPKSWMLDGLHFNPSGSLAVAKLLHEKTARAFGLPPG